MRNKSINLVIELNNLKSTSNGTLEDVLNVLNTSGAVEAPININFDETCFVVDTRKSYFECSLEFSISLENSIELISKLSKLVNGVIIKSSTNPRLSGVKLSDYLMVVASTNSSNLDLMLSCLREGLEFPLFGYKGLKCVKFAHSEYLGFSMNSKVVTRLSEEGVRRLLKQSLGSSKILRDFISIANQMAM